MARGIFKILFWGMFIVYLYLLIDLLFLSRGEGYRSVNLIPFETISSYINVDEGIRKKFVDVNVWGNILIFIPAGMYFMLLCNGTPVQAFFALAGISISVEAIQYIFALGSADIDDVILNALGGLIGILFFLLLFKILKSKSKVKGFITGLSAVVGIPVMGVAIIVTIVNWQ